MRHAIWAILAHQGRTQRWLAGRCGYSPQYIKMLAAGLKPIQPEFRRRASAALDLPESVLFVETATGSRRRLSTEKEEERCPV